MGRKRKFDERDVLDACAAVFVVCGYEGASLDDLVKATSLLRGSLYSAYGSKRGMFLAALKHVIQTDPKSDRAMDLILIALLELAPRDAEIRQTVTQIIGDADPYAEAEHLGTRLLARAGIAHVS